MDSQSVRRLAFREGAPARSEQLSTAEAHALHATRALTVTPTETEGVWTVAPATQVGVLRVTAPNGSVRLQVAITPKADITRLVFLMGYARSPDHWREDLVELDPDTDLPEALAHALARLATRALDQGVLKGYVTVDESLPVLRGRLHEADQMRCLGLGLPLEVRYDDYSVDIAENQILLAAIVCVLRVPSVARRTRTLLQRLRVQLADVALISGRRPTWTRTRLNARYEPALVVAEMILDGRSFELRSGGLVVSGFLLNMAKIFEDFVCVALREALMPFGGRGTLQYPTHLDVEGTVAIQPDFVWSREGRPVAVADAKYKAEKPAGFPQADLYQVLAYCTVLGLDTGHLIYAKGEAADSIVQISGSPVRIVRHVLDLEAAPLKLVGRVDSVASATIRRTSTIRPRL